MSIITDMQMAIANLTKEINAIKTNAKQVHEFEYIVLPFTDTDFVHIDREGLSKKVLASEFGGGGGSPGGATWGAISGNIDLQTDLKLRLDAKEDGLGNPLVDGYALFSTVTGDRYWYKVTGGGEDLGIPPQDGYVLASDTNGIRYWVPPLADKHLSWEQTTATSIWNIEHNLDKNPSVSVSDSAGSVIIGHVEYIDINNLKITFNAGFKGTAYLN